MITSNFAGIQRVRMSQKKTKRLTNEILLEIIEQMNNNINELIQANQELEGRVESLERFERDFERWQAKIKSHGGFVTGDSESKT